MVMHRILLILPQSMLQKILQNLIAIRLRAAKNL
jgi:hypothetical protein